MLLCASYLTDTLYLLFGTSISVFYYICDSFAFVSAIAGLLARILSNKGVF